MAHRERRKLVPNPCYRSADVGRELAERRAPVRGGTRGRGGDRGHSLYAVQPRARYLQSVAPFDDVAGDVGHTLSDHGARQAFQEKATLQPRVDGEHVTQKAAVVEVGRDVRREALTRDAPAAAVPAVDAAPAAAGSEAAEQAAPEVPKHAVSNDTRAPRKINIRWSIPEVQGLLMETWTYFTSSLRTTRSLSQAGADALEKFKLGYIALCEEKGVPHAKMDQMSLTWENLKRYINQQSKTAAAAAQEIAYNGTPRTKKLSGSAGGAAAAALSDADLAEEMQQIYANPFSDPETGVVARSHLATPVMPSGVSGKRPSDDVHSSDGSDSERVETPNRLPRMSASASDVGVARVSPKPRIPQVRLQGHVLMKAMGALRSLGGPTSSPNPDSKRSEALAALARSVQADIELKQQRYRDELARREEEAERRYRDEQARREEEAERRKEEAESARLQFERQRELLMLQIQLEREKNRSRMQ